MAIEIHENSRCTFFCKYALVYCYQRSKIYRIESSLKTPDKYSLSNVPFKPRSLKEKLGKLGDDAQYYNWSFVGKKEGCLRTSHTRFTTQISLESSEKYWSMNNPQNHLNTPFTLWKLRKIGKGFCQKSGATAITLKSFEDLGLAFRGRKAWVPENSKTFPQVHVCFAARPSLKHCQSIGRKM